MKSNGQCAVFIFLKNKSCHAVVLTDGEQAMILNLLEQMHEGKIKVGKEKYPLSLEKK